MNIEASKNKEVSVFLRFREKFSDLDLTSPITQEISSDTFMGEQRQLVVDLLNNILTNEDLSHLLPRGDYKELLDLTLFYLGAAKNSRVNILRPGATHQARWMAKLIYGIKIVMLKEAIQQTMSDTGRDKWISDDAMKKITRFVNFVTHIYVPWWFQCPISASAPNNDLTLVQNLVKFSQVDEVISREVLKGFKNHYWYLVQEMVPLSLFDPNLTCDEKSQIAVALLRSEKYESFQNRHGTGYGKPVFPTFDPETAKLASFVGPDSWKFFELLKIDPDFLNKSPETWPDHESYQKGLLVSKNFKVCNDSAERGVKLSADFLGTAQKEKNFQNVLQIVENHRKEKPDQKKRKRAEPSNWYLHVQDD